MLRPDAWILLVFVAGVLLLGCGRARLGTPLLASAVATLLALAVLPIGSCLLEPLEERFPPPAAATDARVDGIVVLGGAFETGVIRGRHRLGLNGSGERILELVVLARRHPQARIVFAGGAGSLGPSGLGDALPARAFLEELGVNPDRVVFEERARNTRDNALLTRELLEGGAEGRWLLVTSAFHMPRAMGAFRQAGWSVAAHPVDWRTAGGSHWRLGPGLTRGLLLFKLAVQEWVALGVYRWRGWTDAWLPAPTR